MEIIRIPTRYHRQLSRISDKDRLWIFDSIMILASGGNVENVDSMAGDILEIIWRDSIQMENRNTKMKDMQVGTILRAEFISSPGHPEPEEKGSEEKRIEEKRIDTVAIAPEKTPKQITKEFFNSEDQQEAVSVFISEKYSSDKKAAKQEVEKFVNYWTEKTGSGKKELWETKKTFEVKLRLLNWVSRSKEFSPKKANEERGGLNFDFTPET